MAMIKNIMDRPIISIKRLAAVVGVQTLNLFDKQNNEETNIDVPNQISNSGTYFLKQFRFALVKYDGSPLAPADEPFLSQFTRFGKSVFTLNKGNSWDSLFAGLFVIPNDDTISQIDNINTATAKYYLNEPIRIGKGEAFQHTAEFTFLADPSAYALVTTYYGILDLSMTTGVIRA